MPLSAFLGQPAAARGGPAVDWPKPISVDDEPDFARVLQSTRLPRCNSARPTRARSSSTSASPRSGIEPGKPFDYKSLSPDMQTALRSGMEDGQNEIDARRNKMTSSADFFGTREFLKNDYLARAVGAQVGIYANSKDEALVQFHPSRRRWQLPERRRRQPAIRSAMRRASSPRLTRSGP